MVGRAEGQETVRNDPVHVAVLDFFVELVGAKVELAGVEEPGAEGGLEAAETAAESALVAAHAVGGVAVGDEGRDEVGEHVGDLVGGTVEFEDLVSGP